MIVSDIEALLMPVFLFLLMLGLGAALSINDFVEILRRPKPLLIGLASQYGWMPLVALILALTLNLPPAISVGLIIVSCASGGPLSNFFAYVSRADLALSISMTVASTLCGLFMIPLLLFVYTAPFVDAGGDGKLLIPYGKIIATLVVILIPVGFGVLLRSRNPRWANRVERGGSVAGVTIVILVIASAVLREGAAMLLVDPTIYVAGLSLAPIGFALGYLAARTLRLARPQRRAVSLETGIQNVPLALAIILISFPPELQSEILVVPILFGVTMVPMAALVAWLFRRSV